MRSFAALLFLMSASTTMAGTAVFHMEGDTIVPVQEHNIELHRQSVYIKRDGDFMNIEVLLSFDNRNSTKQKRLVGFVAPPALYNRKQAASTIEDFSVKVNGKDNDFFVRRLEANETTQRLGYQGNEVLYLFEVTFGHRGSFIRQNYRVPLGMLDSLKTFDYSFHSCTLWNPRSNYHFHLELDMGPNAYFAIPAFLERSSDRWRQHGSVKIEPWLNLKDKQYFRRVYAREGFISFTTMRFSPKTDLHIRLAESAYDFVAHFGTRSDLDYTMEHLMTASITSDNAHECRNLLYALHGYRFDSLELRAYFSNAYWYIPGEDVQNDSIVFNKGEQELLEFIDLAESVDRRQFWHEYLLPLYKRDFNRIGEFVAFPLDGWWEDFLDPPKDEGTGTIDDFIAIFDTMYENLMFDLLETFEGTSIEVRYDEADHDVGITVNLSASEFSVFLIFERISEQWKLIEITWVG